MGFWFLLGAHDALASLGLPTFQYLMEYGFIGFAMVVLWVIFRSYLESSEEEKYRVITEFATDSILVIQKEKIVFKNRACYDLFGWISEDSVTNKIFNLVVPEKKETVLKYFNTILEGGHVTNPFTIHIRRENGEQRFVEIASSLLHYRDKPAVLTIMRDMTERKQVEDALHRSEKKLSRAKKMETIGLLAGGVAHDLNNILSGIVSYPELLLMDLPKNSKLRKPVETIKSSGLRAAAIVQDLLTVARGVATTKKPLNLNDIIDDYLISPEFIKLKQFHSSVSFSTNIDRNLLNISGSQVHIRKVVMNLVSNASEAIDDSGNVSISTENRYLDRPLKGYDEINIGEYAVLSVSDDGPGISPDDLERIFEPFYTKKLMGRSGTGLGLTVVWNTVQDHNGYIHVIADENGTTFELYFLITRDEILDTDQRLPIKDYKGNKETILVVDDVESQREISCKMLDILGYNTKAVSSGEKAVEYLKLHNVDLVLLDMIMDPGINGRETYEMIIQIHPQQKAIIASGYAQTDEVKKAQQLGVSQFIRKPFTLERIGLAVKKGLKK
ncbi:MAG: response regulator [Desulfobacteraceae bacterium]|nr:response regulator [Desulfobacteraceae bacterium]